MNRIAKTLLSLFSLALTAGAAYGQDTQPMSLQQCIDYALQHQAQVRSARIDEAISLETNKEVTGQALPQVSATGSFQDNVVIQKQLIDASMFDPTVPKGTLVPFEFGIQYNAVGSITLSQTLFDPSVMVALQARKTLEELAHKSVLQTERDTRVAVSKAYYNVLINRKQMVLVDDNISRIEQLLRETDAMYKNGFAEKLDIDRTNVQLTNLRSEKTKLSNLMHVGELLLKFQMGMPMKDQLTLSDTLNFSGLRETLGDAPFDYSRRIDYSLLETQKRVNEFDLKRYKLAKLPTLTFSGTVGTNRASTRFDYFNLNNTWYGYGVIGLDLHIPIFSGFQQNHRIQKARLNVEKSQVALDNMKQSIDLELDQTHSTLESNLLTLQAQERNMKLAEDVYNTTKKKYQAGVGSNLEVVNAENDLKQAQTNYFSALYDAIISKIDYQKAVGQL
ncbi:TolC family protein [Compostibacter hankyongensis]|uniref:TolC family protein n=1 Tax=Compostibacter hankyongensis TaxID=1007089 RepID=A0ABP8FG57_9BACT